MSPSRLLAASLALVLALAAGCGSPDADTGPGEAARVILVTGSTDGLGRELALRLAGEGTHLIIHGRDAERGAEVVREIEEAGRGSARFLAADFASLAEVRDLAQRVRAEHDRLDLLVNNAGVGPGAPGHERVITPDGHELRFQVNYLAGYLLVRELLPLLEAAAPSRIVHVTSRNQQPLDFDDLRMDDGYSGSLAYGRSKLAQILFTMDLAEELEARGVVAHAVHPAPAMETGLVLETGSTPQSTVAEGVESVLHAIRTDAYPGGTFFFELEAREAHAQAYDREARRILRKRSEAMVEGFRTPGVP